MATKDKELNSMEVILIALGAIVLGLLVTVIYPTETPIEPSQELSAPFPDRQ
jgi:hypothetical protein